MRQTHGSGPGGTRTPSSVIYGWRPRTWSTVQQEIARWFAIDRFPALVFLDARHRVRARIVGVPTQSELMRGIRIAAAWTS